jgi:hypothetical protein
MFGRYTFYRTDQAAPGASEVVKRFETPAGIIY